MPPPPKTSIQTTAVNNAVAFTPPGEEKSKLFVMTLVDPTKQTFVAWDPVKKEPYPFLPTDLVMVLPVLPPEELAKLLPK